MHQALSLNIPTLSTFQEHAIPSPQILGWLSAIIWQLAGKTFFFPRVNFASSVTSLCQTQIILWLKVINSKYASLPADGGFAIPKPGFFTFLKHFEVLNASWHALLSHQLFIMMSGYSHGRKGKMNWERKQVKERAADNSQAGCVLIVTD